MEWHTHWKVNHTLHTYAAVKLILATRTSGEQNNTQKVLWRMKTTWLINEVEKETETGKIWITRETKDTSTMLNLSAPKLSIQVVIKWNKNVIGWCFIMLQPHAWMNIWQDLLRKITTVLMRLSHRMNRPIRWFWVIPAQILTKRYKFENVHGEAFHSKENCNL